MHEDARLFEVSGVPAVRIYHLPVIHEPRGSLSFAQYDEHLPFTARRYFVVYNVPSGVVRGAHAHREAHQFLVCVKGSCSVAVDDGRNRDEILLDSPARGIYLPPLVWATQQKYSSDAVLLVLSSDVYNESEYVRDYDEFLRLTQTDEHESRSG